MVFNTIKDKAKAKVKAMVKDKDQVKYKLF